MDAYYIDIIQDEHRFHQIKNEWDALINKDPKATLFQLWNWKYTVWTYTKTLKDQLNIVLVYSQAENGKILCGIFPFCMIKHYFFGLKIRVLEFIGNRFSDFERGIVDPKHDTGVHRTLADWISTQKPCYDLLDMNHLYWNQEELDRFYKKFDENNNMKIQKVSVSPYLILNSAKSLFDHLSDSGFLKYMKRKIRKLGKDFSFEFKTLQDKKDLKRYFPVLIRLNRMRSQDKLQKGVFRNERAITMFRAIAEEFLGRDMLRFHILLLNREPVACLFNFQWKQKEYFYQSGIDLAYRKYSVGHLCHYLAIERALQTGCKEYDFLNGAETYKSQWTQNSRDIHRLQFVSSPYKTRWFQVYESVRHSFYDNRFLKQIYFTFKH